MLRTWKLSEEEIEKFREDYERDISPLIRGINMKRYYGLTYPHALSIKPILWIWKKLLCVKNKHLFDEVFALTEKKDVFDHYLICDACALIVNIESIDLRYCDNRVFDKLNESYNTNGIV